ncbi:SgcJ/EcaC family oxidoreductase [Oligoflexus tunisiensis]|uniref:SgcJ/EcaC family oxidoreductase n=1 Tax=Oligoflexus tunisiensis TaxID=708132 RepID=UPI00114D3351|nr:SgcJ/EcaC family oxidoreductase [Oligoflexus tunisiensis]
MKNIIIISLALLIVGWIAYSIYSELRFAAQFADRIAERARSGPILYSASGESSIQSLQDLYHGTLKAWCDGNGTAYGAAFTEDVEYIAFTGEVKRGRPAIIAGHQDLFDKWLKGTCLVGAIESIRFLSADTAVIVALGGTTFDGRQQLRRPSIQTYIAKRNEEGWLFSNFQNSRVSDGNILEMIVLGIRTSLLRM